MNNKEEQKIIDIHDLVTVEVAKFMREIGFNKPTHYYYLTEDYIVEKGLKRVKLDSRKLNHNRFEDFVCSAPTKKTALKFLKKIGLEK